MLIDYIERLDGAACHRANIILDISDFVVGSWYGAVELRSFAEN